MVSAEALLSIARCFVALTASMIYFRDSFLNGRLYDHVGGGCMSVKQMVATTASW